MARPPDFLTVPIPMDVQTLTEQTPEDVTELFMQKLIPLLSQHDTVSLPREQLSTALTSLASSVRNSLSMQALPLCTMQLITE